MILNNEQLIGLRVATKSGQVLGKIKDFELNADNSKIINYIVSSSDLVKKIISHNLIVSSSQVIEITPEQMIVDDNIVDNMEAIKQTVTA